jgi:hypothetical protein
VLNNGNWTVTADSGASRIVTACCNSSASSYTGKRKRTRLDKVISWKLLRDKKDIVKGDKKW